jgi:hypothetical protein
MAAVESETALSMEDAAMFKTKDGRSHTYGQVVDKLWAYACLAGSLHGTCSDLSVALTNGLTEICPS